MIRTLVADRDDTIRAGIRFLLGTHAHVIDEVRNYTDLITCVRSKQFDLIIVEPMPTDDHSDTLIKTLRTLAPDANVLVFTSSNELTHGVRAITAGARGFLMKTCSIEEFINAAERVSSGRISISSTLAERWAQGKSPPSTESLHDLLTKREIDVYSMLIAGKRVGEIARLLNLSAKTVSTHKTRILSKVSCTTLPEMISHAITHKLIGQCRAHWEELLGQ
jgi:DNA-binding NarL/FixJ family response regulator